jgi:hypothetical protein
VGDALVRRGLGLFVPVGDLGWRMRRCLAADRSGLDRGSDLARTGL